MKLHLKSLLYLSVTLLPTLAFAQDSLEKALQMPTEKKNVQATFKATKLINIQTNETIYKNELDFRVDHRFGDIAGSAGVLKTFLDWINQQISALVLNTGSAIGFPLVYQGQKELAW
ncbi:DUF5777 family beta-barrel protein [Pedobacter sp. P26]|uniref:DUF5777 family beta-barrel protein n=1 Tax=Pedobacter sp. P26 TaxID=3423956 RepID=UPI003D66BBFE